MAGFLERNQKGQTMSNEIPDLQALVRFGILGMAMASARLLSIIALCGVLAISFYSVYFHSWIGACCAGILALFCFIPALKAETKIKPPPEE